jgi:hypothetical protein
MVRYRILEDSRRENERNFRQKLFQSFPRFLAYCAIMRACRPVPQFRLHKPVVVGLVLPEGAEMEVYEDAARYAAHGRAVINGGFDGTEVLTRKSSRSTKSGDPELTKSLAKQRRVVLVADGPGAVPDSFLLAADAVVEIGPILPRHVIAAARLCLRLAVSQEHAEFIATIPLPIIVSALRRGRPVTAAIDLMKKATASKPKDVSGPTLDDLHGLGEAGEWGRELATDLADWRTGKIGWEDVDRGILLSGPPGTGKTTFAGALARTCGVHLVLGSLGRWQAKGHLGDLLKAMRAAFDEARRNAPSIVFIDEIDAVGDRERFSDHNAQYCTEVVAALLECIDGFEGREGVVVVGACNHPDRLDAALVRAGRLDRHVQIPLPDRKGREGILRWHLQSLLPGADLSAVAARTEGLMVDAGDVISVAISSAAVPNGGIQDGGGVLFREGGFRERTRSQILDAIAVRLGGLAAEEVLLGDRSAGAGGTKGSDLHGATLSALTFEASYGLGEGFAYLSSNDEEELFHTLRLDRYLQARIDKVLAGQFARVKEIVENHRQEVERVAEALLVRGSLTGDELRDVVAQQPRLKLVE